MSKKTNTTATKETATQETTTATTATAETTAVTYEPRFARVTKDVKSFCNDVKVVLNTADRTITHSIVDYYLSRHNRAFKIKERTAEIKVVQSKIDKAIETFEISKVVEGADVEKLTVAHQLELEVFNVELDTIKQDYLAKFELENYICSQAFSIVTDTLYASYKASHKEFVKALKEWFKSYGIDSTPSLISYITNGLGIKESSGKDLLGSGNAIACKSRKDFEKLFLAMLGQLYKEKNVVNFVKFEKLLLEKREEAIVESRAIVEANKLARLEAKAKREKAEADELAKREALKASIEASKKGKTA